MGHCDNHQNCMDNALLVAQQVCQKQGVRLTELREQVLMLIWQSHQPLGAYALLDRLADKLDRRIAPPTVYRALDFLLEHGLIHRINSLNAYIGCSNPDSHDGDKHRTHYFFICDKCQNTQEFFDSNIAKQIHEAGSALDFTPQHQWLEVTGICGDCRAASDQHQ